MRTNASLRQAQRRTNQSLERAADSRCTSQFRYLIEMINRGLVTVFLISMIGCGLDEYDPTGDEYFGDAAIEHFSLCDRPLLPADISDAWVFDGGTFNGMIYYVSFKCESIEDCWAAVNAFRAPGRSKFIEGINTKFAVNQYGPNFYLPSFKNPKWNVSTINDGVFYETAQGDRHMDFWAIDREELRVYFHHESGGFPDDPPTKRHQ